MERSNMESPQALGDIVGGLATDVQEMVKGQIALVRLELQQKVQQAVMAGIWVLGGALVGFAGLVVLLEGLAALLALTMPIWVAAMIVGVLIMAVGALLVRSGMAIASDNLLSLERTSASLHKDARMVKEHI